MRKNIPVFCFLLIIISFSSVCTSSQSQKRNESVLQSQSSKWLKVSAPTGVFQELTFAANGDLYGLIFMGLLRSTDNGQTWTKIKVGAPGDFTNLTSCAAIDDGVILVGSKGDFGKGSIILRSADGGKSWTYLKFAPTGGIEDFGYEIESLAVGSNGDLWAGAELGTVFRSTDKGKTWAVSGKIESFETVAALAFAPDGQLYAAVAKTGIFRSDDGGRTWKETGYGKNSVDSLVINKQGHLFAGTMKRGVLRSLDGGQTWAGINDGLPALSVPALALDKDGYLYGGTTTNGFFRRAAPTTETRAPDPD